MTEPSSGGFIKELAKDPQWYVIAVFIVTGGTLLGTQPNATWYVGVGLIGFGVLCFIVKSTVTVLDGSFKRKYTDVIDVQTAALKNLRQINQSLSKTAIAAHTTMTSQSQDMLAGGYTRNAGGGTSAGTSTTPTANRSI